MNKRKFGDMELGKKDIENAEKGCGKTDAVPYEEDYVCCGHVEEDGRVLICKECSGKLEALKFADKRFEEFIERLTDKFDRFNENEIIDNLVEEFNCPAQPEYASRGVASSGSPKMKQSVQEVDDSVDTNVQGCGKEFEYDDNMPMTCGMLWNGKRFYCDDCKKKGAKKNGN